ncbi:MAG: hypothetical protein WD851_13095 [Pirellulales bacterium]
MRQFKVCLIGTMGLLSLTCTTAINSAVAAVINNGGDSWAREVSPAGTFDGDLISVWSTPRNDGGGPNARYGSIEFNVAGETITAASLGLWSQTNGFSDDSTPLKQSAAILSNGTLGDTAGIPAHPLSWNDITAGTLHPLEALGKYDVPAVDVTPSIQNKFLHSLATANDLANLATVAAGDGRLILVLIADEDGTGYSKSWGDGEYDGQDGFLATNENAVPEPAAVLLALLAAAATAVVRIRS